MKSKNIDVIVGVFLFFYLTHPINIFLLRCVMEMRELTVLAGSFVGFQLLLTVVSPRLSSTITPGYTQLPSSKLTEWNSRCVTLKSEFHCTGKTKDG